MLVLFCLCPATKSSSCLYLPLGVRFQGFYDMARPKHYHSSILVSISSLTSMSYPQDKFNDLPGTRKIFDRCQQTLTYWSNVIPSQLRKRLLTQDSSPMVLNLSELLQCTVVHIKSQRWDDWFYNGTMQVSGQWFHFQVWSNKSLDDECQILGSSAVTLQWNV